MTLTQETLDLLRAPFPVEAHELREGGRDGKLVYLTEEPLADRLTEADPNWTFEIKSIEQTDYGLARPDIVTCHAELTVCGIKRANVGVSVANVKTTEWVDGKRITLDPPVVFPLSETEVKGAATDALKRCARMFGVGTYLLRTKGEKFNSDADFARWYKREFGGGATSPKPDRRTQTGPGTLGAPKPKSELDEHFGPRNGRDSIADKPEPVQAVWADDDKSITDLCAWARDVLWLEDGAEPLTWPHVYARIAKALRLQAKPKNRKELQEAIRNEFGGDKAAAASLLKAYEPGAEQAEAAS